MSLKARCRYVDCLCCYHNFIFFELYLPECTCSITLAYWLFLARLLWFYWNFNLVKILRLLINLIKIELPKMSRLSRFWHLLCIVLQLFSLIRISINLQSIARNVNQAVILFDPTSLLHLRLRKLLLIMPLINLLSLYRMIWLILLL